MTKNPPASQERELRRLRQGIIVAFMGCSPIAPLPRTHRVEMTRPSGLPSSSGTPTSSAGQASRVVGDLSSTKTLARCSGSGTATPRSLNAPHAVSRCRTAARVGPPTRAGGVPRPERRPLPRCRQRTGDYMRTMPRQRMLGPGPASASLCDVHVHRMLHERQPNRTWGLDWDRKAPPREVLAAE